MTRQLIKGATPAAARHGGIENREHPRVPVFIPVSCVFVDADSNPLYQCMGAIKDVSQSGTGIEVPSFVRSECIAITFVDLGNKVVEIRGKVVFSRATSIGTFKVGVKLLGGKAQIDGFVAKIVRHHHYTKNIKCVD